MIKLIVATVLIALTGANQVSNKASNAASPSYTNSYNAQYNVRTYARYSPKGGRYNKDFEDHFEYTSNAK